MTASRQVEREEKDRLCSEDRYDTPRCDEADIIRQNIAYHRARGVDHFVVTTTCR